MATQKVYSEDLRRRVLAAYETTNATYEEVAARFGVSVGFVRMLRELHKETGGITRRPHGARVLYLPPYSPDHNPIELGFSEIKGFLRSKAAWTKESLDQALTQAFACVTASDTAAWIGHCGYALLNR